MNEPIQESLEVVEHTRWVYTVRFKLSDGRTILFSTRNVPELIIKPMYLKNLNIWVDETVMITKQQYEVTVDANQVRVYSEYDHATAYIQELIDG